MSELKNKKGFTLIELLIVMSVIAVLAGLAIGGYTAFRKIALVDLNADLIVSQMNEMRDKAIHGTGSVGDDKILQCYGFKFEENTTDNFYKIVPISQNFIGKKVWKDAQWKYQGCDSKPIENGNVQIDSMVVIEEIFLGDDPANLTEYSGQSISFRFVPPNGLLEVQKDALEYVSDFTTGGRILSIKIRYGAGTDDRYARNVLIDLESGKVTKN